MLGRGEPADPGGKPSPGSLPDLLSRLGKPGVPGAPPPRLNPADIESFKALARRSMISDGVPPDQIESRLNDAVARTQQWMDNGMPKYVPPAPPRPPPPGFGDGFADRWFSTEQGIQNLTGKEDPARRASWRHGERSRLRARTPPQGLVEADGRRALGEVQKHHSRVRLTT